ncbi:Hint domain-containing protein [Roseicyclus persicicus]|uniref:Hint domain-containing protein n=1 Tax=Roseicyclus persicicus TaxID=2650661 RepID=A0A7X6GYU7_9RHOB|nr:Hint domain-containing protein [Roseibacterium persicicum]NKX44916.1 Hint domain-containing protein [Roseibacterium persicicum]
MANVTTTKILLFSNSTINADQLTFTNTVNLLQNNTAVDADNSGTATAGDYLTSTFVLYSQYTVNINGEDFAIFVSASTGELRIPHDGQLDNVVFTSPLDVTFNDNAQVVNCFAAGTRIRTPGGDRAVETLAAGDLVMTADGRSVPVKWLWRQTLSTRFGTAERLQPVRVRAGALGEGLPQRDLVVTADHALSIDGLLVDAGALVNGHSIDRVPLSDLGELFAVYHVETADHDLILAEGVPAETFIDYAGRQVFDNHADYMAVHGEAARLPEMPAPRISAARMLPAALKARLGIARAA